MKYINKDQPANAEHCFGAYTFEAAETSHVDLTTHKDIGLSAKGMQKKRRGAFPDGGLRHAICRIGS